MTINYTATPWVRPVGVSKLPLIAGLRNPQNDNTKNDYLKDGPSVVLKIGPTDYRMWFEGLTDQTGSLTNRFYYATSTDGYTWVKDPSTASLGAMDPNGTGTWEKGEICPSAWVYDPVNGVHLLYYHGGNNAGPRQIGYMTSPTGLPGTWTRGNSANPILANGGSGAWDESYIADAHVARLSATDWRMIYKGVRVSDGKAQLGYATSTDGRVWTKYVSNPVMALGSGNDVYSLFGAWVDVDELGRAHLWYPGVDSSTTTQRVLYAYSDDWITWTRNQADVIATKSATTTDCDGGEIGDVVRGFVDDGLLWFTVMNFNASTYAGDALGRLEGRGIYWIPRKAATTPTRTARAVRQIVGSGRSYMSAPVGARLLNQATAWSIWMDFRCPPANTTRFFYEEYVAFNKQIKLALNTSGQVDVWYRASTLCPITSSARFDDNKWHRLLYRRTADNAFSLYVDGVSVGTSSVSGGSDATALTYFDLLGVNPTNVESAPIGEFHGSGGLHRRLVTIAGYAMSDAEELTLWNSGNAGGAAPSGGTKKLDLLFGSGGAAGPDVDTSLNAFSVTSTGAVLVNPAATATSITPLTRHLTYGPLAGGFYSGSL